MFPLIVGCCRVYIGAHSIPQVGNGILLASLISHCYLNLYHSKILEILRNFLTRRYSSTFSERRRIGISLFLLFPIINIFLIGVYNLTLDFASEQQDNWIMRIKENCPLCYERGNYLGWKDYKDGLFLNFLPILLFFLLIIKRKPYILNLNYQKDINRQKLIKRMVILIAVLVCCVLPETLLKYIIKSWKWDLVGRASMLFLVPWALCFGVPKIYKKLELEVEGDIINL